MALLNLLRSKNARLAVVRPTPGCTQLSAASAGPYNPHAIDREEPVMRASTNHFFLLAIAAATTMYGAACTSTSIADEASDVELDVDPGAGIDHPVYVPEDDSEHPPLDRGAEADTMDDDSVPTISAAEDDAASLLDDAASEPADDVADWVTNPNDGDQDEGGEEGDEMNEELGDLSGAGSSDDSTPSGTSTTQIPTKIRYVLVIVKENRTFDNYFTGFPGADWATWAYKWNSKTHKDEHFKRPFAPDGTLPTAPVHSHTKALAAYRDGHMDGFSVNAGMTPYMRYHESQLSNYWKYARDYVLADHYFSTTLAPSAPGHEVFWFSRSTTLDNGVCHKTGGTGCGHGCEATHETVTTFNPTTGVEHKVKPCFNLPSLADHLPTGFDWIDYGGQIAKQIKSQEHVSAAHYASTDKLLADMKNGKLHNLMIAHVSGGKYSEHPPEGPCDGQRFTTDVINAAMKLPQWKQMAVVVTWDDWGGFYDHVKPKVTRADDRRRFGNGFRLPLMVISPYAKKGFVLKHRTEQASVPRLVEELWGMTFMSTRNAHARDGIAGSLLDAFDFHQSPRTPEILARGSCPGD
jgi:phospholipase C